MTTAGYLISRAAEQPPILSLTTIDRRRSLPRARPAADAIPRAARVARPRAPRARADPRARVRAHRAARAGRARRVPRGDLLSRMVGDVDALQALYLRGIGPPLVGARRRVACVARLPLLLPAAALVLAAGLLLAGIAVPAARRRGSARRAGGRQAAARGELDGGARRAPRGAPELVAYGREEDALARVRAADRELVRLGRRDALVAGLADAASIAVAGLTTAGVLALAVVRHDAGALDRVLVATLALLALSSFETVAPLPAAARELPGRSRPAGASRADVARAGRHGSRRPCPRAGPTRHRGARGGDRALSRRGVTALEHVDLRLEPGERIALVGPSGAGKTTITNLLLRFLDPEEGSVSLDGRDLRSLRQEDVRRTFALAGQEAHVFDSTIRENLRLARPQATDDELLEALTQCSSRRLGGDASCGLDRSSARTGRASRAANASGSSSRARSSRTRPFSCSTSPPRISTRRPPRHSSGTSSTPRTAGRCS